MTPRSAANSGVPNGRHDVDALVAVRVLGPHHPGVAPAVDEAVGLPHREHEAADHDLGAGAEHGELELALGVDPQRLLQAPRASRSSRRVCATASTASSTPSSMTALAPRQVDDRRRLSASDTDVRNTLRISRTVASCDVMIVSSSAALPRTTALATRSWKRCWASLAAPARLELLGDIEPGQLPLERRQSVGELVDHVGRRGHLGRTLEHLGLGDPQLPPDDASAAAGSTGAPGRRHGLVDERAPPRAAASCRRILARVATVVVVVVARPGVLWARADGRSPGRVVTGRGSVEVVVLGGAAVGGRRRGPRIARVLGGCRRPTRPISNSSVATRMNGRRMRVGSVPVPSGR